MASEYISPAKRRRMKEKEKERLKAEANGGEFEYAASVAKFYNIPRFLIKSLMDDEILTRRGDTANDRAILIFLQYVRRKPRFVRWLLSHYTQQARFKLLCTAGLNDQELLVYNLLKDHMNEKGKRVSTKSIQETLKIRREFKVNTATIRKVRQIIKNERYRLWVKKRDALGTDKEFEAEERLMESLTKKNAEKRATKEAAKKEKLEKIQEDYARRRGGIPGSPGAGSSASATPPAVTDSSRAASAPADPPGASAPVLGPPDDPNNPFL